MSTPTIHTIDLKFQGLTNAIASYVIESSEGPVLVETGPMSTKDQLVAELGRLGYQPTDVRHVFVTHIHLDHAGALGWWASQGSNVYVHFIGAPHVIDPSQLLASALRVFGDSMQSLWGEVLPAPDERVTPLSDGDRVRVGDLEFVAIDSPGHAVHHMVYRLNDVAFTGDAAGVRLPGARFIDLPAVPPEFDQTAWFDTIERMRAEKFSALYPTHFARVDDVEEHLRDFCTLLEEQVDLVSSFVRDGLERDDVVERYRAANRDRSLRANVEGVVFQGYEAANPSYMSVDGILRFLKKTKGA